MHKTDLLVRIATQGFIGQGGAPGTVATALAIPVVIALHVISGSWMHYSMISVFLLCIGSLIVHYALPAFDEEDPSPIVLDEMVCFLFVFVGVPVTFFSVLWGFGLFRFFDIVKPFGIKQAERLSGVYGVMADDLLAALLSNIILRVCLYGWYGYYKLA